MLRGKPCKKCGGKMQLGGAHYKAAPLPEDFQEYTPEIPGNDTQYFQTGFTQDGFGQNQSNPYNAMDASYAQAQRAEQFTTTNPMLPKQPNPVKRTIDPYFALHGVTNGLSWLSGMVERKRQNAYLQNNLPSHLMNSMASTDYQPNPINPGSDYGKFGGVMRSFSNSAEMDMTDGTYRNNRLRLLPKGKYSGGMHPKDKNYEDEMKKGGWIQKAINPAHKGFCSPMTKSTCTGHRRALALLFKKKHGFHK